MEQENGCQLIQFQVDTQKEMLLKPATLFIMSKDRKPG